MDQNRLSNSQMTLESATAVAEKKINESSQHKVAIKEIKEKPDGWVFYYDSEQAVKTGDLEKHGVPGNVPLFVGKDGSVKYLSGSKLTIETAQDFAAQAAIKDQIMSSSGLESNRCISFLEQKAIWPL